MTPEEREAFYDAEIAPGLVALAKKCADNGLSMVAVVEWAPGDTGRTQTISADAGIGLQMTYWAAQANGNADSLILAMMKHGERHGHNSMCLHRLAAKQ